jgi:hypothetical protein
MILKNAKKNFGLSPYPSPRREGLKLLLICIIAPFSPGRRGLGDEARLISKEGIKGVS